MNKEQYFKNIIDAIRMTERHFPEEVVIEQNEDRLRIYSPNSSTFRNTEIIATVSAMKAINHLIYDESINKVALIIF